MLAIPKRPLPNKLAISNVITPSFTDTAKSQSVLGSGTVATDLPEPTEVEGYLDKLKRNNSSIISLSSWNTRYFWLDPRSCQLLYYKNKKTSKRKKPNGGFRLEDIIYICFDDQQYNFKSKSKPTDKRSKTKKDKVFKNNYQFSIQTAERYYVLRAKTHGEFRKWTRALSVWLNAHMERMAASEKKRLVANGLSLYPRNMHSGGNNEFNSDNVDQQLPQLTANAMIKNHNVADSTLSESTISNSPNSDLGSSTVSSNSNNNFSSPRLNASFQSESTGSKSSTSSRDDNNKWPLHYNDTDLNAVKHCLDLEEYTILKHGYSNDGDEIEGKAKGEDDTFGKVDRNVAFNRMIGASTTQLDECKSNVDNDDDNDTLDSSISQDLLKLKLQSELCLKQLKNEIDKKTRKNVTPYNQNDVALPPPPPKQGRRSLARKTLLNMKKNTSPNTMAKLVRNVGIKKQKMLSIETKLNDKEEQEESFRSESERSDTENLTPVHAIMGDDDSDEEDSFIIAKNDEQNKIVESKFDLDLLNSSELVLSDEEEEEDFGARNKNDQEDQGIWLVDKNSWDDDDDRENDVHNYEGSKCNVDAKEGKANEVVDMDTWDSSDDSDTDML